MDKDFDTWNSLKKELNNRPFPPVAHPREVWWCSLGLNIGIEIDGKHEFFRRPCIIIRKFNKEMMLVVPTTNQKKIGKYYFESSTETGNKFIACISQIRVIDSNRLSRKIGTIREIDHVSLLDVICGMIKRTQ